MEKITLEMIDEFMEATGMDFESARAYLLAADGDMKLAVEAAQSKHQSYTKTNLDKLVEFINDLVKKGQLVRIVVRKDEQIKLDIPVSFGVVGIFFAKFLSVAAFGGALLTGHSITLEQKDGKVIDVKEMLDKAIEKAKETGEDLSASLKKGAQGAEDFANEMKEKVKDVAGKAKKDIDDIADEISEEVEEVKEDVKDKAKDLKDEAADVKKEAKDKVEDVKEEVKDKAKDVKDKAADVKEKAKDKAEKAKEEVKDKAADVKEKVKDKAAEVKEEIKS